jgi:transcriptional regulator with XRE-family HTH domain
MDSMKGPLFLAENIRLLRKEMLLSQEELASQVGLNRGNIASYEKGLAEPRICNLIKMARLFKVDLMDLLTRDLRNEGRVAINGAPSANGHDAIPVTFHQAKLADHVEEMEELEKVVESIYNCHCFKIKNLEEKPKDVQSICHQFDQLHEITLSLLESHRNLLNDLHPSQDV